VHVPWCVRKCPYCDFNSHALAGPEPAFDPYVERLLADLDAGAVAPPRRRPLISIFIGGGTPSLFPGARSRPAGGVRARIGWRRTARSPWRPTPGPPTRQRFRRLPPAGVNRLSIGVQSLSART
jgi:coproporphyrinogen III oxidase-like Fe-S oxidoreductase